MSVPNVENSVKSSSKQRRSRTGCLTCRKRKKRCDELRPQCSACTRLGLVCEYPIPGLERKNKPRKSSLIPSISESEKAQNDLKHSDSDASSTSHSIHNYRRNSTTTSTSPDTNSIFNQIHTFDSQSISLIDPKLSPNRLVRIHEYVQENEHRNYGLFNNNPANFSLIDEDIIQDHPSSESSSGDSVNGLSYNEEQALLRLFDPKKPSSTNEMIKKHSNEHDHNEFNDNEQSHSHSHSNELLNFSPINVDLHDETDATAPLINSVADEIDNVVLSRIMTTTTTSGARIEEIDNDSDNTNNSKKDHMLSLATTSHNDFLDLLANPATPPTSILTPPPATFLSLRLDEDAQELFNYFCTRQAELIAVAPNNSFLDEFVPMAMGNDAVLYGIIAWAGFHRDRGHNQDLGYRYLNKAMQSVVTDFPKGDISTLAGLLVITSGEICNGDVVHWSKHLSLAAKIINMNGGLKSFLSNKSLQWLAKNFAYHDILAASTSTQRNTHFSSSDYSLFLENTGGLDTLLGCAAPLFRILAEISDLAIETHKLYSQVYDSEIGLDTLDYLQSIQRKVQIIENKINTCTPDRASMLSLTDEQIELQMKFFKVFQLTAKMHLYQSVLRVNASSVQIRCISRELFIALDSVLGTKVEGGLVFPLFIAGVGCCTPDERAEMIDRFHHYYERNLARNIRRARQLLEEVWKRDSEGTRHVHWFGIIESRGWDLCFS